MYAVYFDHNHPLLHSNCPQPPPTPYGVLSFLLLYNKMSPNQYCESTWVWGQPVVSDQIIEEKGKLSPPPPQNSLPLHPENLNC